MRLAGRDGSPGIHQAAREIFDTAAEIKSHQKQRKGEVALRDFAHDYGPRDCSVFFCAPTADVNALAVSALLQHLLRTADGQSPNWFSMPECVADGPLGAVDAMRKAKVVVVLFSYDFLLAPDCIAMLGLACKLGVPFVTLSEAELMPSLRGNYVERLQSGQVLDRDLLEQVGVSAEVCAQAIQQVASSVPLAFRPEAPEEVKRCFQFCKMIKSTRTFHKTFFSSQFGRFVRFCRTRRSTSRNRSSNRVERFIK